eukprot:366318-Chlamydomonas_euryale.AAC.1
MRHGADGQVQGRGAALVRDGRMRPVAQQQVGHPQERPWRQLSLGMHLLEVVDLVGLLQAARLDLLTHNVMQRRPSSAVTRVRLRSRLQQHEDAAGAGARLVAVWPLGS